MVYLLIFFTLTVASLFNFFRDVKLISLVIYTYAYFFLLFIVGFRYASVDYFGYEELFKEASFAYFSFPFFTTHIGTTGMEIVWASLSSLFNFIGLTFPVWVFFVAFLSITIKFYFFKKFTPYF